MEIVRDTIAKMSTSEYFNFMAEAMQENPAVLPQDAPIVARMARIGIVSGKLFDISQLSPEAQKALQDIPQRVIAKFKSTKAQGIGRPVNGWQIPEFCGEYGTDYSARAMVSAFGWGCNIPEDAVFLTARVDEAGNPLTGANTYLIHFNKGETPPIQGFWSITMYDSKYYIYPNALNKLTVNPCNKLQYNADGSLDLYFSHLQPDGVAQANWLPAPANDFILMLRLYWPRTTPPSILPPNNPSWIPPPLGAFGQAHDQSRLRFPLGR
jgi:hypothetical protein